MTYAELIWRGSVCVAGGGGGGGGVEEEGDCRDSFTAHYVCARGTDYDK